MRNADHLVDAGKTNVAQILLELFVAKNARQCCSIRKEKLFLRIQWLRIEFSNVYLLLQQRTMLKFLIYHLQ